MLRLVEIDRYNYLPVLDLRVSPEQEPLVASNQYSLAQAYAQPECVPLALYAENKPVGFAMYALDEGLHHFVISAEGTKGRMPMAWYSAGIGLSHRRHVLMPGNAADRVTPRKRRQQFEQRRVLRRRERPALALTITNGRMAMAGAPGRVGRGRRRQARVAAARGRCPCHGTGTAGSRGPAPTSPASPGRGRAGKPRSGRRDQNPSRFDGAFR